MSARKVRLITVILLIIVASATVLGWELVYQQTLAQRFIDPPGLDVF
jgi:hypothetical protein